MIKFMIVGIVIIFALYVIDDLGKYHMDKKYGDKK